MKSTIIRAISADASVRAFAIDGKNIVEHARKIHNLSVLSTAALGRTLMGASMMGCLLKNPTDTLTLQVRGDGELGAIIAVSDNFGNVRGYVENPSLELELSKQGKIDVGRGVGAGTLTVVKDLGLKEPYIGRTKLVSGEIAEDITHYFATSEQVPTVCALGVLVDTDYSVKAAGGFLIQLLPFADESVIDIIEKNLSILPTVTKMLEDGLTPTDVVAQVLAGLQLQILSEDEVGYVCPCSIERMKRGIISLGKKEISDIIEEQGCAELVCHFCNTKYDLSKQDLLALLDCDTK